MKKQGKQLSSRRIRVLGAKSIDVTDLPRVSGGQGTVLTCRKICTSFSVIIREYDDTVRGVKPRRLPTSTLG